MDLSAIWAKAQGDRELPEPAGAIEVDAGPFCDDAGQEIGRCTRSDDGYSADQMRAAMTPDPAALQRFAEAVRAEDLRVREVFARWMAEACGVLFEVEEEAEDGGESLRMLRERGLRLVRAVLHPQPGELPPWLED